MKSGSGQRLLGPLKLRHAQGRSVGFTGVLFARRAAADGRAHEDERRPIRIRLCLLQGAVDGIAIETVRERLDVPSTGVKAFRRVFRKGKGRGTGQANAVVVIQDDQLAETEVPGERAGFGRDALHQVPVTGQHIREMVHNPTFITIINRRQVGFRDGHADGAADPLSQRPGGHFHARGVAIFRMARGFASPLPELLQIGQFEIVTG